MKLLPDGFKISDMKASLGFEFEYTSTLGNNGYFYYQRDSSERGIDISGYDYLFDAGQYNSNTGSSGSPVNVTYNYDTSLLKVFYNDKEVYSDDFNAFVKALIDKHGIPSQDSKESMLPASEMTQVTETDKLKIKVVYMSISGNVNQSQSIKGKGIEFYVLVKVK